MFNGIRHDTISPNHLRINICRRINNLPFTRIQRRNSRYRTRAAIYRYISGNIFDKAPVDQRNSAGKRRRVNPFCVNFRIDNISVIHYRDTCNTTSIKCSLDRATFNTSLIVIYKAGSFIIIFQRNIHINVAYQAHIHRS